MMRRHVRQHLLWIFLSIIALMGTACAHTDDAVSVSPFAAIEPYEAWMDNAETIVTQANSYDARAMAFAAAGYCMGLEGFPKDPRLGFTWANDIIVLGPVSAHAFAVALCVSQDTPDSWDPELWRTDFLASAAVGRKSPLAPLFRNAGLFDIEAWGMQLASSLEYDKETDKAYEESLNDLIEVGADLAEIIALLRELVYRPATEQEANDLLRYIIDSPKDTLVAATAMFYAGTTHDIEQGAPDWSAERLGIFATNKAGEAYLAHLLRGFAVPMLVRDIAYTQRNPETLRLAHQGDPFAMHTIAGYYAKGSFGFPENSDLAHAWFRHSALRGDAASMAIMAIGLSESDPDAPEVWAWATLAAERGDTATKALADAMLNNISSAGFEPSAEARALLEDYRRTIADWERSGQKEQPHP